MKLWSVLKRWKMMDCLSLQIMDLVCQMKPDLLYGMFVWHSIFI